MKCRIEKSNFWKSRAGDPKTAVLQKWLMADQTIRLKSQTVYAYFLDKQTDKSHFILY